MKVYEYGEVCPDDGIHWSKLVAKNERSFSIIKASFIAKLEYCIADMVDEIDSADDDSYLDALTQQNQFEVARLNIIKSATTFDQLCKAAEVFVTERDVSESINEDYWVMLSEKTKRTFLSQFKANQFYSHSNEWFFCT